MRDAVEPRAVQAAVLRGRRPPGTRALLAAAVEVGRRERHGAYGYPHLALGCCQA